MHSELRRIRERKQAKSVLTSLFEKADLALVIHYSCESFYKHEDGTSSRIASISIKYLGSGSVNSFSIHQYAEKKGIQLGEILNNYESIERLMLADFFSFVSDHFSFTWLHWNMRNVNFGFQALEHRYEVLGGEPRKLPDSKKVDLSALLKTIYGVDYASKPVLVNLCQFNNLISDFFMPGADEAEAFEKQEFRRLHQSTLKKVDFISYIAELALNGKLKSNSNWFKAHGIHPSFFVDFVRGHWVFGSLALAAVILGFSFTVLRLISAVSDFE
jgi:hypothetical protein